MNGTNHKLTDPENKLVVGNGEKVECRKQRIKIGVGD